jgi:hypothetical protein
MKTPITILTRELEKLETRLTLSGKLLADPAQPQPDIEEAEAIHLQLQTDVDELQLALDILTPIEKATAGELERWKGGYQSLRDHCINTGVDLGS